MHPSTDIEGRNEVIRQFAARLDAEWLPSFCSAPHRRYTVDGFRWETLDGLSAHDAFWFMRAIDKRLVEHEAGVFLSPMSMAKEQIFWTGSKAVEPRPPGRALAVGSWRHPQPQHLSKNCYQNCVPIPK